MAVRRPASSAIGSDLPGARAAGERVGTDATTSWGRTRLTARRIARRIRGRHLFILDLVGIATSAIVALWLRSDVHLESPSVAIDASFIALIVATRLLVGVELRLYSRDWRFASIPELELIVVATGLGSLLTFSFSWVLRSIVGEAWPTVTGAFWVTELLLCLAVVGSSRFAIRATSDFHSSRSTVAGGQAAILYGAGRTGVLMARSAQRSGSGSVVPVGFLDDDPGLAGGLVAGIRVLGGLDALRDAVDATGARMLIITMPSAPGHAVRRIVDAATALDLEVRTVPSMIELLDGALDVRAVRRVRVEDLLRRPSVKDHAVAVDEILRDRTVVITGAGGSIGSELARQVQAMGPRRLVLIDRAESPLYLIQRELLAHAERAPDRGELRVHLANVASRAAMERIFREEQPSVVFHAAAYKQVPMLEDHPSDAVQVNIGGTMVLLDVAEAVGVERFVLVSTDKAVRPASVMGASKRLAELLVTDVARRSGRPYVSVRFGNVLGSTGSVVPIFQDQLEHGEPLTITDPHMTRYFMTIQEASWLILDAAALGRAGGDLFVLDMGEPVRLMDLANDLVRLSGRDPDRQPMKVVGLRPGEKLHEQLFYEVEQVEATASPKVLRAVSDAPATSIRDDILRLISLADGSDEARLRYVMMRYAQGVEAPLGGLRLRSIATASGFVPVPVAGEAATIMPGSGA